MAAIDPLYLPFPSWEEGLLMLTAALSDPDREKIIVARLEATAVKNGSNLKDICALALLVRSHAHFDAKIPQKHPDHPLVALAVAAGEKLNDTAFSELMEKISDADRVRERTREEIVFAAFSESDPRRILKDTIIGFAAAALADVSRRLGEADPFSRLARRLSLWFKPYHDYSRYGLPLTNESTIEAAVHKGLLSVTSGDDGKRILRLIDIWAGNVTVEASEEGIREILSLVSPMPAADLDGLDGVLVLETYGALADDIESGDLATLEALFESMKMVHGSLDDGRPGTAVFSTWLANCAKGDERFRLTYDPSETFGSMQYCDLGADALEPLLQLTLEPMTQGGHSLFAIGPFPIRGSIFNPEGTLLKVLAEQAPEPC
jgi:hypothetical protein